MAEDLYRGHAYTESESAEELDGFLVNIRTLTGITLNRADCGTCNRPSRTAAPPQIQGFRPLAFARRAAHPTVAKMIGYRKNSPKIFVLNPTY